MSQEKRQDEVEEVFESSVDKSKDMLSVTPTTTQPEPGYPVTLPPGYRAPDGGNTVSHFVGMTQGDLEQYKVPETSTTPPTDTTPQPRTEISPPTNR